MRALYSTSAFLLATLALAGPALAHVPVLAPRVSLSLALDWNNLVMRALHAPPPPPASVTTRRHVIPKLSVTDGAQTRSAPQLEVQAVSRVENWARSVVSPRYDSTNADAARRTQFRTMYVTPFVPYMGCYGLNLTVETNALLR
ncbi:MAG: hypothetical protein JWN44_2060 [Myxococcales bacterium]|nr:hypothetical protein [Myxococcales bacterium]